MNDFGQSTVSIGSPGSIMRFKAERPKLINDLVSMPFSEALQVYESLDLSKMEKMNLLQILKDWK